MLITRRQRGGILYQLRTPGGHVTFERFIGDDHEQDVMAFFKAARRVTHTTLRDYLEATELSNRS